ncbi:hypothetical protein B0H11DRAFT_1912879 [Mycena galericulata]|nr:hypothetical protein B0H11DRAFT_1912879 [Mycena galericulata]
MIEGHLTRCFALWDLNWLSICFMLVQTESLVAGLWARHLLFPNHVCRLKKTDILEFFVQTQAERGVIRYFEAASSWEQVKSVPPASALKFLEGAVLLQHKDRTSFQYIALHVSGDIPALAIYRQPLTAMFVSMSGNGLQVPYADLTFGNLSMVNHEFGGELSTSEGKTDMHNLFRSANEAGVTIIAYHSTSGGLCARDATCPAVVRTSLDNTSFSAVFRSRGWVSDLTSRHGRTTVVWSLSGKGCGKDMALGDFFVESFDTHWASTILGKGYQLGWGKGADTWLDEDYIESLNSIIQAQ